MDDAVDQLMRDALQAWVRVWAPVVADEVPPDAAAELAALAIARRTTARPEFVTPGTARGTHDGDAAVLDAVCAIDLDLRERLHRALAPVAREIADASPPSGPSALLPEPLSRFAVATMGGDGPALEAVRFLRAMRPGTLSVVRDLLADLGPSAGEGAAVPAGDDAAILAAHGAAHLGRAITTALAVLPRPTPGLGGQDRTDVTAIGTGTGLALLAMTAAPEPDGYRDAVTARERAEYVPATGLVHGSVRVRGHRFALAEGPVPTGDVDVSATGLAAAVPGGVVVRTGTADGSVYVTVRVQDQEPTEEPVISEEVVDVSFRAVEGFASVIGADGAPAAGLRHVTPPRPGDHRVRVEAWGRDAADAGGRTRQHESYTLTLWPADPAPPVVHRRTDRLGHRLRGEPEAAWPQRPELAYAWIRDSELSEAATVTVVTGSDASGVLRAFGAAPDRPTPREALAESYPPDPWVSVLDLGDAVLAVELNGWQGSHEAVLQAASASGRAASMYWNVNALTRLSFAEHGRVLDAFEVGHEPRDVPEVAPALAGLDFDHGDWILAALLAVERFTGHRFTRQHLERIQAADQAYLITPADGRPG